MDMPEEVRINDLEIYKNVTDPGGPAMTWAMFSAGYTEVGQYEQADSFFKLDYANIQVICQPSTHSFPFPFRSSKKKTKTAFSSPKQNKQKINKKK